MRISLRFKARMRKEQQVRWTALKSVPPGPEKIALLIRYAQEPLVRCGRTFTPDDQAYRRRSFTTTKGWRGNAGLGLCQACGRSGRLRSWHHVLPLCLGGSNGPKNLIRVCHECHAQIHLHLAAPVDTDDALYRLARQLVRPFDATPRLVRGAP